MDHIVSSSEELGHALRLARRSKGLSRSDLGRLAATNEGFVLSLETAAAPSVDTLVNLINVLGLEMRLAQAGAGETPAEAEAVRIDVV